VVVSDIPGGLGIVIGGAPPSWCGWFEVVSGAIDAVPRAADAATGPVVAVVPGTPDGGPG
jgi:hypothetical protein